MKHSLLLLAFLWPLSAACAQQAPAPETASATPSIEVRAKDGEPSAMLELGREFLNGTGRPRDPAQAMEWFLKGAEKGDAASQVGVGYLLNNGLGCPADKKSAGEWFRRAAEQGNAKGQHNLAVLLREGALGPARMPEALDWFKKAAAQGMVESQALLGEMYYLSADGVPQDFAAAAIWLEKAAAAGHNPSRTVYGSMLRFGNQVAEDKPRALTLFKSASGEGYAKAMCQLADMLAAGEGGAKEPLRAAAWYYKAAALGESAAQTGWDNMAKTLSVDEAAEARRIAAALPGSPA